MEINLGYTFEEWTQLGNGPHWTTSCELTDSHLHVCQGYATQYQHDKKWNQECTYHTHKSHDKSIVTKSAKGQMVLGIF